MKFKKLLYFFIIIIFFASCKKEITAAINVKVHYQNKQNNKLSKLYFLLVSKNGELYKKYSQFEKPYIEKEFLIDSLKEGTYKFTYQNLLNQTLEKTITVKESKIYNVSIKPDFSNYKNFVEKSLVKNLVENQKVEFIFKRISCMGWSEGRMILTRKGKIFIAESDQKIKELNQKELDLLIKMECELYLIQNGGCTTSDHYIIKSGNVIKEFYDRTCSWDGWANTFSKIKWNIKKTN